MSKELRDRSWRVLVGGVDVSRLDLEFDIHKSLRPEPNTCSVKIYNLSEAKRTAIEALTIYDPKQTPGQKRQAASTSETKGYRAPKAGRIPVEIHAGYKDDNYLLFRGDLRRAISMREGPSWVTEVEGEDGGRSIITARVGRSLPPGTTLYYAVKACAEAMGVGEGNALSYASELSGTFSTGAVLDGQASRELYGILRRVGISFSVQNGVLQLAQAGKASERRPLIVPVLSAGTGLVGDPKRNSTGEIEATSLLMPGIAPGGYVQLETRNYPGLYSVQVVDHVGSTFGNAWYHQLALSAVASPGT